MLNILTFTNNSIINTSNYLGFMMIKHFFYISLILTGTFFTTSCAIVKLTEGGEKARVLSSGEVTNCQKRGATTVSVKPTILTIDRKQHVVEEELQILARNSAVNMGGDTVTPISEIDNGKQTYAVYRCIP